MSNNNGSFWAKFGGAITFAAITLAGVLVTFFVAGSKYEMIEGQEILIKAGSTIQAILMMVGTLGIAFLISRKV